CDGRWDMRVVVGRVPEGSVHALGGGAGFPGGDWVAAPAPPAVPEGPYLVMGIGNAGQAAVAALSELAGPSSVLVFDDSAGNEVRGRRRRLEKLGVSFVDDPVPVLGGVGVGIKSPGVLID